jgi:hypothetical protein
MINPKGRIGYKGMVSQNQGDDFGNIFSHSVKMIVPRMPNKVSEKMYGGQ